MRESRVLSNNLPLLLPLPSVLDYSRAIRERRDRYARVTINTSLVLKVSEITKISRKDVRVREIVLSDAAPFRNFLFRFNVMSRDIK